MSKSPLLDVNGKYLITNRNFVFSNSPEIFLLLQTGDKIKGVCINKPILTSTDAGRVEPLTYGLLARANEDYQNGLFDGMQRFPVMNGGPDDEEFYLLHTNEGGKTKSEKFFRGLYCISGYLDYHSRQEMEDIPGYRALVRGYKNLTILDFFCNVATGDWEVRSGLHFMTYGVNLDAKIHHINLLHKPSRTSEKVEGLDVGAVVNQLMDLGQEVLPSITYASIYAYLKSTSDLTEEEITEAARAVLAVHDDEGGKIEGVLLKYTHEELLAKLNSFRSAGMKMELLANYNARCRALTDLGLNHVAYDAHVARWMLGPPRGSARSETGKLKGRHKMLAKMVGGIASIIAGRKNP